MSGPSKQERSKSAYVQKRDEAERRRREVREHQEYIAAINTVANQLATDQDQQNTSEGKRALREKVTIGLLIATVIAAGAGDVIFYLTMREAREAAAGVHQDNVATSTQAATANKDTNREAEQTRVESSRAWIGPGVATIDALPIAGRPVVASIAYQNTGREPARNFTYAVSSTVHKLLDDVKGKLAPVYADYMTMCFNTPDRPNAGVVYPSTGFGGNTMQTTFPAKDISQGVVGGTDFLVIQGCFIYRTFNKVHHSSFCMYYINPPKSEAGQPAPPLNLNLRNCVMGNNAD